MGNDVVISGLGVVSPLGHDVRSFWDGLLRGEVPVRPLDRPGTPVHGRPVYAVVDAPGAGTDDTDREPGRASGFALVAARAALQDAGLGAADAALRDGIGVCVGTGNGDSDLQEAERDGLRELSGVEWYPYGTSAIMARELGVYGPGLTVSTACTAGAYAVSLGAEMITNGEADVVIAGGTEAVCRPAIGAFLRLGASDPLHCRPFDVDRAGTVYGEGAAMLVLESAEHAAARGHLPRARVLGSGWSCDGFHATAPDPSGVQAGRAAREALERGGVTPEDVGALMCHGTGTPANDSTESRVAAELLGDRTPDVPAAAVKASLGHSGGAAGAFACVAAVLVLESGLVPPVGTLRRLDPSCGLSVVRDAPAPSTGSTVLVNAYAFGGNNISVAIGAASGRDGNAEVGV
ncbi:beta-ketoacyl-[acyl-carrier-protein] synthase family protein [Streptomyces sp. NPDC002586]